MGVGEAVAVGIFVGRGVGVSVGGRGVTVGEATIVVTIMPAGGAAVEVAVASSVQAERVSTTRTIRKEQRFRCVGSVPYQHT